MRILLCFIMYETILSNGLHDPHQQFSTLHSLFFDDFQVTTKGNGALKSGDANTLLGNKLDW